MAEPVYKPGIFANYIAPPRRGINQKPVDFEYVRTEQ
jgi:benzoyl-CoA 2,3-dioxygenase component B